ncbi:UNVERIFIED_CONTAM: hypothetical protein K2H54_029215 [Gekko kuhli]
MSAHSAITCGFLSKPSLPWMWYTLRLSERPQFYLPGYILELPLYSHWKGSGTTWVNPEESSCSSKDAEAIPMLWLEKEKLQLSHEGFTRKGLLGPVQEELWRNGWWHESGCRHSPPEKKKMTWVSTVASEAKPTEVRWQSG